MTTFLRWGLLNTAHINDHMISLLHTSQCSELGTTRQPAKARAFADRWEIPHTYGSYAALLTDPVILLRDGRDNVAALAALYASARKGRPMRPNFDRT